MIKKCVVCEKSFKTTNATKFCSTYCRVKHQSRTKPKKRKGTGGTLCWSCQKATGGCSWSRVFTPVEGYTTEKAIINISLGARYAINEHLSAFLDGHNLLNRHHQYYAGYPSQGISVMAGAAFKF